MSFPPFRGYVLDRVSCIPSLLASNWLCKGWPWTPEPPAFPHVNAEIIGLSHRAWLNFLNMPNKLYLQGLCIWFSLSLEHRSLNPQHPLPPISQVLIILPCPSSPNSPTSTPLLSALPPNCNTENWTQGFSHVTVCSRLSSILSPSLFFSCRPLTWIYSLVYPSPLLCLSSVITRPHLFVFLKSYLFVFCVCICTNTLCVYL